MYKRSDSFELYIGIGLIVTALAHLLFEFGLVVHGMQLTLYIVGISLEVFGFIKYHQSRIEKE